VIPSALLGIIESREATHAFFVPAVVQALLADPAQGRSALRSLKVLAYGGSPMPAPLMERTLNVLPAIPLYSVYGMTETSGVFCVWDQMSTAISGAPIFAHRPAGRCAGNEVRVVDPATGTDVTPAKWANSGCARSR